MTNLYILGGFLVTIITVVIVSIAFGKRKEREAQYKRVLNKVENKKRVNNEVENMGDDKLLGTLLKFVRKGR